MSKRAEEVLVEDVVDDAGADAAVVLEDRKGRLLRTWAVPAIVGSSLFMQTLNANSINNALPAMAHAFSVDPVQLNVAITSYLLGMAVFLPVSGWIADRFGARRVFMVAMALYAVTSAACGLTNSLPGLLVARLLQGFVGAVLTPVGRLVLLRSTPKNELVGTMAVFTMPALLGPVIGPVLGGAIVTFASWRWIFFMNTPVAIAGVLLVRAFVPEVKEQAVPPLDWPGIGLTGVTLAALVFGFSSLGHGGMSTGLVAGLFGAGFIGAALYWRHAHRAAHPVVDLKIFRLATFKASVLGQAFFGLIPGAMPFLLAMLLQVCFGLSAFAAGLMTFTSAIGSLIMRTTAPAVLRRYGFRSVLIVNGSISATVSMGCFFFRPETPHWVIIAVLTLGGFFRSLQFTSLSGMAYAELEDSQMSRATTASAMIQQFMQSVTIGLAASLLQLFIHLRGDQHLVWEAVTPVFLVTGLASLVGQYWFFRLPKDAGDDMNNRAPPQKPALA